MLEKKNVCESFLTHNRGSAYHEYKTSGKQLILLLYALSAADDRISLSYFIACRKNSGNDL